jgi:hypothetical protein
MSLRPSIALRNALLEMGTFKQVMSNCFLKVYTGGQPATAEAAPTGTLLCLYTDNAGAATREVQATGTVALTGGGSGSVNTLTVNSIEIMGSATSFNTSLIQTATDIVTKINNNPQNLLFTASNVGGTSATITITAKPGLGALPNGWVVASAVTTITKTDANMASGVTAVNGLKWGDSTAGVISKLSTQTWSGTALATGVAGWFRFEAAVTDSLSLDSTESILRLDGSIATSGAEINMGNTTFTSSVLQTIQSFAITFPTA